ncbi:MAG: N-hydroxyarylamine O-acetyltransferase [Acidimicrobiaceae bacterium]|jgi:N-hydroxyarylamine O-acetyltransferase|nr:N-hydroxyarylamine O-acetyltransferase [Acidimicrobiaceae bacterium]
MDAAAADAYLARLDVDRPSRLDADALALLHERHLRTIPFENLDIHLGVPIVLEEAALFDKIVTRHRGGLCYELNGLFAALLRQLGFAVTVLAGRVFGAEGIGPVFDHMALGVDVDEPWLADVGFGRLSHLPLKLDSRDDQKDPGGSFRLLDADYGDLDLHMGDRPQYRLERRPRELSDFEALCWWQQTSPKSNFRQGPVCSMLTDGGRVTVSGRLMIETIDDVRSERSLDTDAEMLDVYRERFGIDLACVPTIP